MNSETAAMVKATAKRLNVRKLDAAQLRFIRDDATAAAGGVMTFGGAADKYVLQALAVQQELDRRG
jgi:ABC-type metal ion transport system substrate-binding protein